MHQKSQAREPRTGAENFNATASSVIAISDDVVLRAAEAKLQIAFYATTRTCSPILEDHGREKLIPHLRAAFAAGGRELLIELIDERLCDAVAATGRAAEVREQVRERWNGVADRVIVGGPWFSVTRARMSEKDRALI
jgi:hypothetical protein